MDFELSKEQLDIQQAVREFVNTELTKDYLLEIERHHKFPWEVWKKACELGFVAINFPEEYGGGGYGELEKVLVIEEFCRQGAGAGTAITTANFGSKIILNRGTKAQKEKYLPLMCKGEATTFGAFTEPDRGSDLTTSPLTTNAVKQGNDYIINGAKTFITSASIAKFGIVLCQTDPKVTPPYKGHSIIIIDCPAPGFETSDWEKMGMNSFPSCQVSFNDLKVSGENLIGEENKGFYYAMEFLNEVRVDTAAGAVGIAQGALDRAVDYAKNREAFGHKIGTYQAISHKLAEMATKVETSRLVVYKAAWGIDHNKIDPKICSIAKWYAGRAAVEVADEAIEIMGGHGYMLENDVERFYRDAKSTELVEGTKEIHKNAIAGALLGKLS
ncbi:MAG: acyl-CoA/acyl-ACP dehydrogenase [Dehalococcoidales bacterium]|nr:acyl-CoA/acyl-ACP dehydrogenase [Dehalococcoidales bacterium]